MFLEIATFLMLVLVVALKYAVVSRIVRLNQGLREAEIRCKRAEERLRNQLDRRRLAERQEVGLARQQIALERERDELVKELAEVKDTNMEVLQQLSHAGAHLGIAEEGTCS